jgi:riboflavin synthase
MFTGIVQELGVVAAMARGRRVDRLTIRAPKTADGLALGESVAVNGVCLSAVEVGRGTIAFETIAETRRRTTLGGLKPGQAVNLERSLRLMDRLSGHLVLGHVDGLGRVVRCTRSAAEVAVRIAADRSLTRALVPKGPIAVDGVSLTLGPEISAAGFSVFVIPETLSRTTLGRIAAGDRVNLEVDYVAKLLAQFARRRYNALSDG